MFELKSISRDSIPEALAKVERYRLLNEPALAESICLDILAADPDNQRAVVALLLTRTDQFTEGMSPQLAREALRRIEDPYEQAYYRGLICERDAHARLRRAAPFCGFEAYELLLEAMDHFEEAERRRPAANDDAILRWNTCARILMTDPVLRPRPAEERVVILDD